MQTRDANYFETEIYAHLNHAQKEAVNQLDGPVMVLAGPGTGKTQIIGARVANILLNTDTQPKDILCLTYTEAGGQAMRNRLLKMIGTAAYEVNVYTYHGFCSDIIRKYPQFFGNRNLEPAEDLQQKEIVEEILFEVPADNVLRIFNENNIKKITTLIHFFKTCKEELFTEEQVLIASKSYEEELYTNEKYFYKVNGAAYKKGDIKQKEVDAEIAKLNKIKEAIKLLPIYNSKMLAKGLFDFVDMLEWVKTAFEKNDDLLALIQPNYLYILVDEFQDNNTIQTNILNHLLTDVEKPNIFVVGDDDQSIYQFQGARIKTINEYVEKYIDSIKLIILTENYRSSQKILNTAKAVIDNNKQRLVVQMPHLKLNKTLTASNNTYKNLQSLATVNSYCSDMEEATAVATAIENKYKAGQPLNEIAVLYKKHKQAELVIEILTKKNIACNINKAVNILEAQPIIQLVNILKYIQAEATAPYTGEYILFEILHYYCFELTPIDIAKLSLYLKINYKEPLLNWRICLANEALLTQLNITNIPAFLQASTIIEKWIAAVHNLSLPMLVHNILYESKIVTQILATANTALFNMQIINTFINFVKKQCEQQPGINIAALLQILQNMKRYETELKIQQITRQDNAVNFLTLFGAKGLEYETVFIISCGESNWLSYKGGDKIFIPPTLTLSIEKADEETNRRLFFVGITRAKKEVYVSYSNTKNDGKEQAAVKYVNEMLANSNNATEAKITVEEELLLQTLTLLYSATTKVAIDTLTKEAIDIRLKDFALSATLLADYLTCPVAFYYNHIVGVPSQPSDTLAYGNAIHKALELWNKKMLQHPEKQFEKLPVLLQYFNDEMRKQYDNFTKKQFANKTEQGLMQLTDYYNEKVATAHRNIVVELNIKDARVNGVPIKGRIDKIDIYDGYIDVVDYKTGIANESSIGKYYSKPSEKNKYGGSYLRQMIFYKILLQAKPYNGLPMRKGIFEYIAKNTTGKYVTKIVEPNMEQIATVIALITETYHNIIAHNFKQGCGETDCTWCNFVKNNTLNVAALNTKDEL